MASLRLSKQYGGVACNVGIILDLVAGRVMGCGSQRGSIFGTSCAVLRYLRRKVA